MSGERVERKGTGRVSELVLETHGRTLAVTLCKRKAGVRALDVAELP